MPEPSRGNIPEPSEGGPYLALSRSGVLAAPPRSSQSSVRVNATLLHPLVTSSVLWDHRAYGAVRHVHSFFPYYNVTDARTACGKRVCSAVLGISHRPLDILQFLFEQHLSLIHI